MSLQVVRQIGGDVFKYNQLNQFSEQELHSYKSSLATQFSKLTKHWTIELHSEWTARMFLAAKMIYSATLLLNTASYSKRKNIRITEPYLLYYSLLNCCRALIFASPGQVWKDGEFVTDNHAKIINKSADYITRLNKDIGNDTKKLLQTTKDYRELFSYKYPANGKLRDKVFNSITIENISDCCQLLCEVAQFTSDCFQSSLEKHNTGKTFHLDIAVLQSCFSYHGDTYSLTDEEDAYRISYIIRKVKRPYNIYYTMTEGMTDNFFGSWIADNEHDDDAFNPDERNIYIFNLP